MTNALSSMLPFLEQVDQKDIDTRQQLCFP